MDNINFSVKFGNYYKKGTTIIGCNDCLYHYTDVNVLVLILKNKTIKFNPLTVLDDLQEQEVVDNQKYGKYCFISSWTEDETESIPMWKMYTNMESGVRIKLPVYPFKEYIIDGNNMPIIFDKKTGQSKMLFNENIFTADGFYPITGFQEGVLYKVEYTDDDTKLNPQIRIGKEKQMTLLFEKLGIYKNRYWAFQKEWRYILFFLPWSYEEWFNAQKELIYSNNNSGIKDIFWKIDKCPDLPFRATA